MFSTKPVIRHIIHWMPPLLCAATIFWLSSLSSLPGLQLSIYDFFFKKIAHMIAYATLYLLTRRAILHSYPEIKSHDWRVWLLPLLICLFYAASDELHQSLIPNRTATARDVVYDFLGMSTIFLRQNRYI